MTTPTLQVRGKEDLKKELKKLLETFYALEEDPFIPGQSKIQLSTTVYDAEEAMGVMEAILSGWITQGRLVQSFEQKYAEWVGRRYAVAVNSGSSANLIALDLLMQDGKLKSGDEVIVPAATFATVVAPVLQLGLKPVYVDVDPKMLNIDPHQVEEAMGRRTKLLIAVHTLGYPADMTRLSKLAQSAGLLVMEDCCESHGASHRGRPVGSMGLLGTFSFFVAHNMTTGEGGMIVTDTLSHASLARSLREFGRMPQGGERYYSDDRLSYYDSRQVFERRGYNMRMTDLTAACGIAQLKKVEAMNEKRREAARYYCERLRPYETLIQLPVEQPGNRHVYYGFSLVIQKKSPFSRMDLVSFLDDHKIESRPLFGGCLPDQPGFRKAPGRIVGKLPVSRWLRDNALFIGVHPKINEAERVYVVETLSKFLERYR
ncbi:MAG: DegT/DnrJ/EryC1/StrS family aminotransferase [Candidatus Omnitrophica bacterium]|nr:DegT/DnrJ/EryC1/StrS family aminotransferase [Candidatus Omnitrophota bacterium]